MHNYRNKKKKAKLLAHVGLALCGHGKETETELADPGETTSASSYSQVKAKASVPGADAIEFKGVEWILFILFFDINQVYTYIVCIL